MSESALLARRVEGLSILSREKVSSFLSGNRRSLFLGSGTEFADLREYVYGDEQRHIDWRSTAKRQNKLIVRDYEVERNTNVIFLLDASASMLIGDNQTRMKSAVIGIASLAHATIKNKDFFGLGIFSDTKREYIPPKGGKPHEFLIYKKLLNLVPEGKTDLGDALKQISTNLRQRSIIMVLSDLHDDMDGMIKGFRIAKGFHHEVKVLQLTERGEYSLPQKVGKIKFMHPEKKKPVVADFGDPMVSGLYGYEIAKRRQELRNFKRKLRGLKIDVIETYTEDLVEKILLSYFNSKRRGVPG